MFTCGFTFDEIKKELKKQKCSEWLLAFEQVKYLFTNDCAGFAATRVIEIKCKKYTYNFVCLRDAFDFSDKHHTTLSHELIHICTYNLSDLLDIVKENEAFAYTHTHLLQQCYEVLRSRNK